ncbi:MAG TPA: hypothetical protein VFH90_11395 [Candidatus Limnocylindria bacterium]|nr:hypothetical protein [Candidatus Limnocylindria bacterium]
MEADALVRDYLGRLEAAAWPLAADRRGELLVEVREHIESALAEAGNRDEVTARNVLERLGAPEEIVAAEAETGQPAGWMPPSPGPADRRAGWGLIEVGALLFLTVGAIFLPIVGPMVGLVLVWLSTEWTTRQKSIATLIVVILLFLPVLLLLGVSVGSTSSGS